MNPCKFVQRRAYHLEGFGRLEQRPNATQRGLHFFAFTDRIGRRLELARRHHQIGPLRQCSRRRWIQHPGQQPAGDLRLGRRQRPDELDGLPRGFCRIDSFPLRSGTDGPYRLQQVGESGRPLLHGFDGTRPVKASDVKIADAAPRLTRRLRKGSHGGRLVVQCFPRTDELTQSEAVDGDGIGKPKIEGRRRHAGRQRPAAGIAPKDIVRREAGIARGGVDHAGVVRQPLTRFLQRRSCAFDFLGVGADAARIHALLQGLENLRLRRFGGMNLKTKKTEPHVVEPILHHPEGRHLLGYEKDRLSLPDRIRDDVGDGLRLSCAGRPLNHEAGPGGRVNHGAHLRGVGIGHEHRRLELDLRMIDVVHRGERIQVSDRRVAVDLLKQKVSFRPYRGWPTLRVEIGPHRLPRERENPDRNPPSYAPARAVAHCVGDRSEIVLGALFRIIFGQFDPVLPQLLAKGYVRRLIVVPADDREDVLASRDALLHVDRQQQQWREGGRRTVVGFVPFQEAHRAR